MFNVCIFAIVKSEAGLVKRPFCNAFTGCGRKRSDPSMNEFLANEDLPSEAELLGANLAASEWNRGYQVSNTLS